MKRRSGWVSNSSSSSFICDVCGDVEAGYDASASDFDMTNFECGHTVCDGHFSIDVNKLTFDQKKKLVDSNEYYDIKDKFENSLFNGRYGSKLSAEEVTILNKSIQTELDSRPNSYYENTDFEEYIRELDETPSVFCPVCNLEHISDKTLLKYIVRENNIDTKTLKNTLRAKYTSLDDIFKDIGE